MATKEMAILDTALRLFKTYGFEGVTLVEIAQAANVSRPTLYASFKNKQAILVRIAQEFLIKKKAQTDQLLLSEGSLNQRLSQLFDIWVADTVSADLQDDSFRELMISVPIHAPEAIDEFFRVFTHYSAEILRPHVSRNSILSAELIANIIAGAARGFRANAENFRDLKRLSDGLIILVEEALSSSQ